MELRSLIILSVVCVGCLAQIEDTQGFRNEFVCDSGKPADVAFFLDTSNSIWRPNFIKMLRFVQGVIEMFVIGPENIQVSTSTFGDSVFTHFNLNRYSNKRKLMHAIGQIRHYGAIRTHTNQALAHAFKHTFTKRGGAREGVTKVAIVITDGRSHDRDDTLRMAHQAHKQGIHVFAIGVGHYIDEEELKGMATNPASENMFMVNDFVGLTRIKDLLAIKTCEVTEPPTTTTTTPEPTTSQNKIKFQTTTPTLQFISPTEKNAELELPDTGLDYDYEDTRKGCSPKQPLDLAFVVDEKIGGAAFKKKMWKFVRNIISKLNLQEGDIRVHLIRECADVPELHLNQYDTKTDIMDHFDSIRPKKGQTPGLLRAMTNKLSDDSTGFTDNDALPAKRHKVGVYITDGKSNDLYATLREAQFAKLNNDIELFAVGITDEVDPVELNALVSCDPTNHLYNASTHSNLNGLVDIVSSKLCDVPL